VLFVPGPTLIFGGDVMLNGVRPSDKVFAGIAADVRRADLAFANVEIPWTTSRKGTVRKTKEELKRRDQFILKADPKHAPFFAKAGFDMAALANNHAMDYGWEGLEQTMSLLDGQKIAHTGGGANLRDAMRPTVRILPDGTRVGLVSAMAFMTAGALWKITPATAKTPGVNTFSFGGVVGKDAQRQLTDYLQNARKGCDLLVVAVHWGTERKSLPNPYQVSLGRALVDAGADIVWGHHPHVLQGAELYRGKPIMYSMGNLISALPGETGLIQMTGKGRSRTFSFIPARISGGKVARLAAKQDPAARRRFSGLCEALLKRFPHKNSKPLL
jgi:poly-gamma-glutamate synthesis protein (capsule biosynthesis protein)